MDELEARLRALADEKYRKFNEGLIPGSEGRSYGVRMDDLRTIAREICKGDYQAFLADAPEEIHEYLILKCLVAAMVRCPLTEKLAYVEELVPKLNNWAVCDCLCSAFKDARKDRAQVFAFLEPYLQSNAVYELRFVVVMLLSHFRTDEYIDCVLAILASVEHEDYYVRIATAWAFSFCFISHRDKTLALLEQKALPPWVQNKAIQKCRESYRVAEADKEMLLTLKM